MFRTLETLERDSHSLSLALYMKFSVFLFWFVFVFLFKLLQDSLAVTFEKSHKKKKMSNQRFLREFFGHLNKKEKRESEEGFETRSLRRYPV